MKQRGISIRIQLMIVTLLLVILPVGIVGTVLYSRVSGEMNKYIVGTLEEDAKLVEGIIRREYENLLQENEKSASYCSYLFGSRLDIELDKETRIEVEKREDGTPAPSIPSISANGHKAGERLPLLENTAEHLGVELGLFYYNTGGAIEVYGSETRRAAIGKLESGKVVDAHSRILRDIDEGKRWKGVVEKKDKEFFSQYASIIDLPEGGEFILEIKSPVEKYQQRVTDFLSRIEIGKNGYIFVLNLRGEYVLSKGRARDGESIIETRDKNGRYFIREMIETAPDVPEGKHEVITYPWRNSSEEPLQEKIAVYDYFEPWDWTWGVSAVRADFAGGIEAVRFITVAIALGFIVLAIIAAYFVGTVFSKPISHLEKVMAKVAEGDFTQKVALRSSVRELKRFSENFDNKLLLSIKNMIGKIKEVTLYSQETGEKISNQVEGTLVFTNQMTEKLIEMRRQIHGLDGQINEASSAVEEIQATIGNVGKQIDQQASSVSETSASIEEMGSSIQSVAKIANEKEQATQSLLDITGKGGEKVRQTNDIIQEIGVSINDMLDMITIINKVAAQTNMLAMNAAIEAAHAGDAGRGFAVVAEEIRNLSSSTSESASKISNRLKEIVDRIQQATEMSTETGSAFEQIEGEVKEFVQAFQEIASSTSELSTGSEEMLNAVNSLQDVAQEIQDGSEEMKNGSRDINESLQALIEYSGSTVTSLNNLVEKTSNVNFAQSNMTDLVMNNNENVEKLAEEVSKFLTEEEREEPEKEGKSFTYSQIVRFSIAALLLQEWIASIRNILNEGNREKPIPKLEEGRLHLWIDGEGHDLFGEYDDFNSFLEIYDKLLNLSREMETARSTEDEERTEELYNQMVDLVVEGKSKLHSLRYTVD